MPIKRLALAAPLLALMAAAPPPETRQQATDVLREAGVDPLPDNYPDVIMNGNLPAVRAMIALGIDPNAKTSLPQSSLELAASACSNPGVTPESVAGIVDALVAAGANPNAPGIQGLGPLMIAAQQCGALVVNHLLAAGAKLDSRTPQGFTPLSMALVTKHYDAADALVAAGARLSSGEAAKFRGGPPDARLDGLLTKASGG